MKISWNFQFALNLSWIEEEISRFIIRLSQNCSDQVIFLCFFWERCKIKNKIKLKQLSHLNKSNNFSSTVLLQKSF